MDQALNEMIDTLERMEVKRIINNEQKIQELIQQSWAMIFVIRQQNPHNPILAAVMHDKIRRIQRIIDSVKPRELLSESKLTNKKNTQISAEPHAIRTNVKHTFRRKKDRADIQKSRDNREKSLFNDNERIIKMQFHSS